MDESQYYKDPPLLILNLMKKTFGDRYNYFLGGSTMTPPEAAFPVLIVDSIQSSNTIAGAPTSTDSVSELIHIYFLEQSKDYVGQSDDEDTTKRVLYQTIQGRDPQTGYYKPGTAMYALRSSLDLGGVMIDHDISIDYDIIPRGDRPTIVEAIITVVTRERVIVQRN